MKRSEVISMILEASATNELIFQANTIVKAAKESYPIQFSITDLEEKCKNILHLIDEVKKEEYRLAERLQKNKTNPDTFNQIDLSKSIATIDGLKSSIQKILTDV